jgi:hypothetical protein
MTQQPEIITPAIRTRCSLPSERAASLRNELALTRANRHSRSVSTQRPSGVSSSAVQYVSSESGREASSRR